MNELKELLKTDFGVCSFDLVREKLVNCRKIEDIPENAKSILVFVFPYKVRNEKPQNISRYAAVEDYHPIVENCLKEYVLLLSQKYPHNKFVSFVDNSPVPEVFAAANAGLGVMGDNGLLITKEYGSFVFIGEIVTDMYIPAEENYKECNKCGLCKKACPVGLDKSRCISKITQQKKPLSEEEERLLINGGSAWGCDICAEICPLNKNKKLSNIDEFIKSYRNSFSPDEDSTNRPYMWRGKEIILRNHNILYNVRVDAHIDTQDIPLPQRKNMRLENYDYSQNGAYFITICTKNRERILSNIFVGVDAHIDPQLTEIGKIADKYINNIPEVDKYVIMPDHIHLIIRIENGTMKASSPTNKDVSNIIRSLKIMITKETGKPIFQRSYYDHIIRNEQDYVETWEYIENNPAKWLITK